MSREEGDEGFRSGVDARGRRMVEEEERGKWGSCVRAGNVLGYEIGDRGHEGV